MKSIFTIALISSLIWILSGSAASSCRAASPGGRGDAGTGSEVDLVLLGGAIYTVNPAQPWVEAMAVRDGVIVALGSDAEVQAFQGPGTRVVDLAGRMAMPGLHDSHIHLLEAFHEAGGTCQLEPGLNPENHIATIQTCAPQQVGTDWVLGFGHAVEDLLFHIQAGGRWPVEILDDAVPDRPALILEQTSHSVWANSRALELAGLDNNTPDPQGGAIVRDPGTGEALGILLDAAGEQLFDLALAPNPELEAMNYQALLEGMAEIASHGITSIADARVYWQRGYLEAWQRARDEGQLTARTVLGLWAYPNIDDDQQIASLTSMYSNDPNSLLRASQIKIYSDGEISQTTAALLEPYSCCNLADPRGLTYFDAERLTRYVTELEAVGFDFHIHAIGDRGVRNALDAIEAATASNCGTPASAGCTPRRHRLTHLELAHPDDVQRFVALDVTADFQMSSEFVEPHLLHLNEPLLGNERLQQRLWRLRDFHQAGARVVLSSDYDVGELSPFAGMQRALTRGAQSLPDLAAAIHAYTLEPAHLLRQETRVGSFEVGKLADVIVLDRNLFEIPLEQLRNTQVDITLLAGRFVWGEPGRLFSDDFESGDQSSWASSSP